LFFSFPFYFLNQSTNSDKKLLPSVSIYIATVSSPTPNPNSNTCGKYISSKSSKISGDVKCVCWHFSGCISIQEELKWAMKWVVQIHTHTLTLTHTSTHSEWCVRLSIALAKCVMKQLKTVCKIIWLELREKLQKKKIRGKTRASLRHYALPLMMLRNWSSAL